MTEVSTPALEIKNLSLTLGGKDILRDISFEVSGGAFLSIVGPNGSGKTSLLRCVMGVVCGWSGDILVCGRPVGSYKNKELAKLVSYVPQSDEKWVPFTGRELVMMGRYPYLSPFTSPTPGDMKIVEQVLETTGTAALSDRDMGTLSGGEKQKIHIAAALAQEAGTLLLDEPTTFLDPRHTEEILSLLAELNRAGVTVVMVTHDVNQATLYADRVIALVEGDVTFNGPPSQFMDNEVLRSVYGKNFTLVPHPLTGQSMILPGEEPHD